MPHICIRFHKNKIFYILHTATSIQTTWGVERPLNKLECCKTAINKCGPEWASSAYRDTVLLKSRYIWKECRFPPPQKPPVRECFYITMRLTCYRERIHYRVYLCGECMSMAVSPRLADQDDNACLWRSYPHTAIVLYGIKAAIKALLVLVSTFTVNKAILCERVCVCVCECILYSCSPHKHLSLHSGM